MQGALSRKPKRTKGGKKDYHIVVSTFRLPREMHSIFNWGVFVIEL